jgi:large subunit ribosomal protein L25
MELMSLSVTPRTATGKGVARKLRRDGFVPAVCYGLKKPAQPLTVVPKALGKLLKGPLGRNVVFNLAVDGEAAPRMVVLRDITVHPVRRTFEHVDFLEVVDDSKLVVDVPVILDGRSAGEKVGGKMRQVLRVLRVECSPGTVPAAITIDVSPLEIGATLYVEDIPFPEGVKPAGRGHVPVVTVRLGRGEDGAPEGAAEAKA